MGDGRSNWGIGLLTIAAALLIAAVTIVATAPTDRGQHWGSPGVVVLLVVGASCLVAALWLVGAIPAALNVCVRGASHVKRFPARVAHWSPIIWRGFPSGRENADVPAGALVFLHATYGVENEWQLDVTDSLNKLVSDGRLDIVVNNETMGEDPSPGRLKLLTVEYAADGAKHTNSFLEGTHIVLP
jgi:hypothetical protein